MHINATLINLYHVCKRECWLHANGIRFEHTSDLVSEGKLIHEESYPQRPERYEELEIDGIKLDFYDARNRVIHEIKKSDKVEEAHRWQLKYYIHVLERNGVEGVTGVLEIIEIEQKIAHLLEQDQCPPLEKKGICKRCSYYDFCYVEE